MLCLWQVQRFGTTSLKQTYVFVHLQRFRYFKYLCARNLANRPRFPLGIEFEWRHLRYLNFHFAHRQMIRLVNPEFDHILFTVQVL